MAGRRGRMAARAWGGVSRGAGELPRASAARRRHGASPIERRQGPHEAAVLLATHGPAAVAARGLLPSSLAADPAAGIGRRGRSTGRCERRAARASGSVSRGGASGPERRWRGDGSGPAPSSSVKAPARRRWSWRRTARRRAARGGSAPRVGSSPPPQQQIRRRAAGSVSRGGASCPEWRRRGPDLGPCGPDLGPAWLFFCFF